MQNRILSRYDDGGSDDMKFSKHLDFKGFLMGAINLRY